MTDKGTFAGQKRTQEEEYFRKQEQELIQKTRRRQALEAERRELSEAIGIGDQEILDELQELGYTHGTVQLLYLVPLVQVAWADGQVSLRERDSIMKAARLSGIEENHPACERLADWLDERPSAAFFEKTLHVISALLKALPPEKREASRRDLVSYCTQVAEVSGGVLSSVGLGSKVSKEERELLQRIAAELESSHEAAAKQVVGDDPASG